jgi:hypothetical protein
LAEDDDLKRLTAQVAEKERLKRLREEREESSRPFNHRQFVIIQKAIIAARL